MIDFESTVNINHVDKGGNREKKNRVKKSIAKRSTDKAGEEKARDHSGEHDDSISFHEELPYMGTRIRSRILVTRVEISLWFILASTVRVMR